ncbi:MAG: hypothetical protein ACI4IN_04805 [Eubacterium sp.]
MEIKFEQLKSKILNPDSRLKLFLIIGVLSIGLILLSEVKPNNNKASNDENNDYLSYVSRLEEKTEHVISSIDGAGKCVVMLTISDTTESIYAKNTEESGGNGNYSTSSEYVLYDGAEGDTPVLVKQNYPRIQGIVVVCQGADNKLVRESIISSVSALYDLPTNKITVTKIKG